MDFYQIPKSILRITLDTTYIPVYNAYSGQTETMQAKWANLKKWKNQGGDQILKEINEELNNSSGN